ncbi:hydrogen peroxide-inducible genes activator [Vibrio aestuarianus]|uniref:Hydrogen peroxide-inducible genes activator n=1 Tax=Vibrio aestuarianus TaxID=28171 RepID=A0A9X4IXN3_9VIBR|nr:hydrogen peroxide-inducible genes activator [Vibrio aestuarianus]MDE1235689.1 hydrogen peroxide-inducible genes activator [Vibrio aestuarianus]MDE1246579.1 hydrogen peroxide-inducible genes activator [Vibrio aestuarianus]MDE1313451.1 hydrogen peroxide-inducible genes activator [Vibrio aestuarianus]MDE1347308.1 hydrogen peroxide-inducible genes activator [Vibrio aestuarianus]NGZ63626.1 hydrogen peroxide-inducible genes activator [Vibrio aestuarianus subsp. cardii]
MNKWPSLKQLHYLVTLHETRHFSDAADKCFVSQSTLSKGIQNLEELIGCPLYEKKDKKSPLVFTHAGELVVSQGRELLAKGQDLIELGKLCQGDDMQGQLKLGCIPTIAPFLLCDLVQEINTHFPKLNLLLREDTTANLLTALRHGELDVLILALPIEIGNMASRVVGKDPFRMVISRHQADRIRVPIKYDDLPDESVFLLENEHCLTEHAVSACKLTDKEKINPFTATSLHTLVQMVANGLGTTFIPQMAIDHGLLDNQNLVVVEPPGQQAYREIGLVWRPSSSRTTTFNQLADVVSALL